MRGLTGRGKRPPIYNERQRQKLRIAGRFNAQLMDTLRPHIQPGVTTSTLDKLAYEYTLDHGHTPACLGYKGRGDTAYPFSICTSLNDVVCHGMPSEYALQEGDIVNVDTTTIVDGWFGDSSETFLIGEVTPDARRLTQATFDALWVGIRAVQPRSSVIEIGYAIERVAQEHKLGIVEQYQGHGLGRRFHQPPGIPHYAMKESIRDILAPGVCFTIEPMLNLGSKETKNPEPDGWTVKTKDGSLSAQFEHTILMTESGPEVLTLTQDGPQEGHRF